jgi:hypothetical protein
MEQVKNQFSMVELQNVAIHLAKVGSIALAFGLIQYLQTQSFGAFDVLVIPALSVIATAVQQYKQGA